VQQPETAGEASACPAVRLTEEEERMFGILVGAAEAAGKGTVARVAGGWVRDKLLGWWVLRGALGNPAVGGG
jgi:hypothetical protein